jgi:membrane associated rhomboid family serine protease
MPLNIKYNSPVILTFSFLCTAIFVMDKFAIPGLMSFFTLYPQRGFDGLGIFTLFSHALGHISMDHLLGNLTFILLLGPIAEEKYGSRGILAMILITALITGLLNYFFFNTGLLGASGIVFMLILLVSFTNVRSGEIPITFILVVILFLGKEILQSLNSDQVSQFAHIIGGFCGSFFGFSGAIKQRRV